MDVKGAFLYGKIDEDVFLKPPQGVDVEENNVLKLKKSLYGLKKSPKYWYECFNKFMTEIGFTRSLNDYCLYTKDDTFVLLYVDDLLILSNNILETKKLKNYLCTKFKTKDLGSKNVPISSILNKINLVNKRIRKL